MTKKILSVLGPNSLWQDTTQVQAWSLQSESFIIVSTAPALCQVFER